ncbi:tRNA pseudouridine(55) synthase TruB [Zavarzinia sp. CC-PAN008]|uniref:tRNA pseudouridine(55) synthase TruB n=1 Tax=Zavarzinia sp. CC-PAN008 TaxID=3243332 RepID=UPI003F744BD6
MTKRTTRPLSGWIVLDKPLGLGSTQAVGRVRRITQAAKVGHGGTLDPLATGVLPIALGEATKAMAFVLDSDKTYRFTIRFGTATTTEDAEGEVIASSDARPADAALRAALPRFTGPQQQVPPAFSALKVDGQRAYDLARAGRPPDLPPRAVVIHRLELVDRPDADHATLEVACGKGTYVRSLARDLALALGSVGHVAMLRRTRAGPFDVRMAVTLETLQEAIESDPDLSHSPPLEGALLPVVTALADIPALAITEEDACRLRFGQAIRVPGTGPASGSLLERAMAAGHLVAIVERAGSDVRPVRVFNP